MACLARCLVEGDDCAPHGHLLIAVGQPLNIIVKRWTTPHAAIVVALLAESQESWHIAVLLDISCSIDGGNMVGDVMHRLTQFLDYRQQHLLHHSIAGIVGVHAIIAKGRIQSTVVIGDKWGEVVEPSGLVALG